MLRLFITSLTQKSNGNRGSGNNRSNNNDGRGGVGAEWHAGNEEQQEEEDNNDDDGSSTMTASPPKLPLDIIVPPAVLQRRGGMCLTGVIIRAFLQLSLVSVSSFLLQSFVLESLQQFSRCSFCSLYTTVLFFPSLSRESLL
ncbi:hypothetical protein TKK_0014222 [Trichogramma kaykai]